MVWGGHEWVKLGFLWNRVVLGVSGEIMPSRASMERFWAFTIYIENLRLLRSYFNTMTARRWCWLHIYLLKTIYSHQDWYIVFIIYKKTIFYAGYKSTSYERSKRCYNLRLRTRLFFAVLAGMNKINHLNIWITTMRSTLFSTYSCYEQANSFYYCEHAWQLSLVVR